MSAAVPVTVIYEVIYMYGGFRDASVELYWITEGKETVADIPAKVARHHNRQQPDVSKVSIHAVTPISDNVRGSYLAERLRQVACATTTSQLTDIERSQRHDRRRSGAWPTSDTHTLTTAIATRRTELEAAHAPRHALPGSRYDHTAADQVTAHGITNTTAP